MKAQDVTFRVRCLDDNTIIIRRDVTVGDTYSFPEMGGPYTTLAGCFAGYADELFPYSWLSRAEEHRPILSILKWRVRRFIWSMTNVIDKLLNDTEMKEPLF